MKNKPIFINLLLVLCLGLAVAGSLYFIDGVDFRNLTFLNFGQFFSSNMQRVHEDKRLTEMNHLEAEELDTVLTILEGNEGLVVMANQPIEATDYFDFEVDKKSLKIEQKKKDLPLGLQMEMVLSISDPDKLAVNIDHLGGVVFIEHDLASLSLDHLEGVFTSETEESYDIFIERAEGIVDFYFKDLDADLSIKQASGLLSLLGEEKEDIEAKDPYQETFKSGRDEIQINQMDGILTIEAD